MELKLDLALILTGVLWGAVLVLGLMAWRRGRILLREGLRTGGLDFIHILPRIMLGVVGSGYLAAVMPQSLIIQWIGPQSGFLGVALAAVFGAITPGGAVVGFAIAATALKTGGGAPQVIAYATAWALLSLQRTLVWEVPTMPVQVVTMRLLASAPLPFLAALGAMLIGRP